MTWRTLARWGVRHRAVVSGCALDVQGKPIPDGVNLCLRPVPVETEQGTSKRKDKRRIVKPELNAQTRRPQRYASRVRPDGMFFFLDVTAGRYVLNRVDIDGTETPFACIIVPPFDREAKLPVVNIDFEIAERISKTTSSSGRPAVRLGFHEQPQLKGN